MAASSAVLKNLRKRRRLSDLYMRGKQVVIDDGTDDPVAVWVQKINPIAQRDALDSANKQRALVLVTKGTVNEVERETIWVRADAEGIQTRDDMIAYLTSSEIEKKRISYEEELGAGDEWSKDGYLEGLRSAWFDEGIRERYLKDNEDEEASKVFDELKRFTDQVEEKLEGERSFFKREYASKEDDALKNEIIDALVEADASSAWLVEFRKSELFHSLRDPEDHDKMYFEDRSELDELDPRILGQLIEAMDDLNIEGIEGKG